MYVCVYVRACVRACMCVCMCVCVCKRMYVCACMCLCGSCHIDTFDILNQWSCNVNLCKPEFYLLQRHVKLLQQLHIPTQMKK